MPRLSIITICFNAGDALRKTIDSVNEQTLPELEHVIIDGGSTDGSVELIQSRARRNVRWLSEPDQGIADAFNKGTQLATGEYICYLNAGDAFAAEDVLERAVCQMKPGKPASLIVYYGDFISTSNGVERVHRTSGLVEDFAWDNPINHQSAFVPKSVALTYPYDKRLVLGMDYDFWLRLAHVVEFKKLPFPIAIFELGGRSSTPKWEVHNLVIHRALWHINRGSRIDLKDIAILALRALRFKFNFVARRLLGQRISSTIRAVRSNRINKSAKSAPALTSSTGKI